MGTGRSFGQRRSAAPSHGNLSARTQSTVTAYEDRVVTVKLKDQGIIQRYRAHSAAWARQQVETALRGLEATRTANIVAAHQLKSGDIQIFTSTTADAAMLKQHKGWIGSLGGLAELRCLTGRGVLLCDYAKGIACAILDQPVCRLARCLAGLV